jgi:hypothetical protein
VGSFTTLTAQVTYLSPFVYTHYIDRDEAGTVTYTDDTDDTDDTVDVNGVPYSTTYINKGQSSGVFAEPQYDRVPAWPEDEAGRCQGLDGEDDGEGAAAELSVWKIKSENGLCLQLHRRRQ